MAYNITIAVVERYAEALQQIYDEVHVKDHILRLPLNKGDNANREAAKLREAIVAARELAVEPWNELNVKISIREQSLYIERKVRAATLNFEVVERVDTVEDELNHFEVVSYMIKNEPQVAVFPNFIGEIALVQKWAENKDYQITATEPLTIKRGTANGESEEA